MVARLTNVDIEEISGVPVASNGTTHLIMKAGGKEGENMNEQEQKEKEGRSLLDKLGDLLFGSATPAQLTDPPATVEPVAKAGRKISSKRLATLKQMRSDLDAIITEAEADGEGDNKDEVKKEAELAAANAKLQAELQNVKKQAADAEAAAAAELEAVKKQAGQSRALPSEPVDVNKGGNKWPSLLSLRRG